MFSSSHVKSKCRSDSQNALYSHQRPSIYSSRKPRKSGDKKKKTLIQKRRRKESQPHAHRMASKTEPREKRVKSRNLHYRPLLLFSLLVFSSLLCPTHPHTNHLVFSLYRLCCYISTSATLFIPLSQDNLRP